MARHLILLHGLWMHDMSVAVLRHRLEAAGYRVETLDYWSVTEPLSRAMAALRGRMRRYPEGVDIVGHSLGGLVALLACRHTRDLPPGRIVCLGSPVAGSAAARHLSERGGAWMLGHSRALLEHGLAEWDDAREVGMVAGKVAVGLGAMLGSLEGDNDGAVCVDETRLPGLSDHCVLETTHTGLLFARGAARRTVTFLRQGRFDDADA